MNKTIAFCLKLVLSGALLAWVFQRQGVDPGAVAADLAGISWPWLAAGLLAQAALCFIGFARWRILLAAQNVPARFPEVCRIGMIGLFFTPVNLVVGDAARVYYILRGHPGQRAAAALSIVADRVVGLFGLFVVALVVLPLNWKFLTADPRTATLAWSIVALVAGGAGAAGLAALSELPGPWRRAMAWFDRLPLAGPRRQMGGVIAAYLRQPRALAAALGMSCCVHCLVILSGWCLARALGIPLSLLVATGVIPIVAVASALPITVAGFGVREGILVLFFEALGLAPTRAVSFSLAIWLASVVIALAGGVVYLFHRAPPGGIQAAAPDAAPPAPHP